MTQHSPKTCKVAYKVARKVALLACHERQLLGLEWKAKVEGSQLRLFKAKEGSKKHEAAHA